MTYEVRSELLVTDAVSNLLRALGCDMDNHHIKETPERVAKYLLEATSNGNGGEKPEDILEKKWKESYDYPVIVSGIKFSSLCIHHMLPFFGYCTLGYFPDTHVVGLSKLPRLIALESKGFQLQEELVKRIVSTFDKIVNPLGVALYMRAEHTCMTIRGVRAHESVTSTFHAIGKMSEDPWRSEFLAEARQGGARWQNSS